MPKVKHAAIDNPRRRYTRKPAVYLMTNIKNSANRADKGIDIKRIGQTLPSDMNLPYQVD
jgi:hypothetical protein